MAMSLNRVQLIGNVTRDPEMKQIPGGQTVTTFGIATNLTWNDNNGEKQTKTEFHNVVAWRKLAEICGQYLKKGTKVFVEGRLQTRDWEGEDGVKRYRTEIVAENMIMLDRKDGAAGGMMGREAGGLEDRSMMDQAPDLVADAGPTSRKASQDEVNIDDLPF